MIGIVHEYRLIVFILWLCSYGPLILVAGGGGDGKSGVPNRLDVYDGSITTVHAMMPLVASIDLGLAPVVDMVIVAEGTSTSETDQLTWAVGGHMAEQAWQDVVQHTGDVIVLVAAACNVFALSLPRLLATYCTIREKRIDAWMATHGQESEDMLDDVFFCVTNRHFAPFRQGSTVTDLHVGIAQGVSNMWSVYMERRAELVAAARYGSMLDVCKRSTVGDVMLRCDLVNADLIRWIYRGRVGDQESDDLHLCNSGKPDTIIIAYGCEATGGSVQAEGRVIEVFVKDGKDASQVAQLNCVPVQVAIHAEHGDSSDTTTAIALCQEDQDTCSLVWIQDGQVEMKAENVGDMILQYVGEGKGYCSCIVNASVDIEATGDIVSAVTLCTSLGTCEAFIARLGLQVIDGCASLVIKAVGAFPEPADTATGIAYGKDVRTGRRVVAVGTCDGSLIVYDAISLQLCDWQRRAQNGVVACLDVAQGVIVSSGADYHVRSHPLCPVHGNILTMQGHRLERLMTVLFCVTVVLGTLASLLSTLR